MQEEQSITHFPELEPSEGRHSQPEEAKQGEKGQQ